MRERRDRERDRAARDRDRERGRTTREEEDEREAETERRGEQLKEAWRQRHPQEEGEKGQSPEGYPGPVVFDDVWLTDSREELTETATRLLFGIGAVVDGLTPSSGPSYA